MNREYYYSLSPLTRQRESKNNQTEIDLNVSKHFQVLFPYKEEECEDLRKEQLKRLEFIAKHSDIMNLIAHILCSTEKAAEYSLIDLEKKKIYDSIIKGEYGSIAKEFFENDSEVYAYAQETILYYLSVKNNNNIRKICLEDVLNDIFKNKVTYYFDSVKSILYVCFIPFESYERKVVFDICKFFFADIFIDIEVRWGCYPLIIGKTDYEIASEGEQLCGTII